MKKLVGMLNWRYRPLFKKEQAKKDPEYIKRKNNNVLVLRVLKKQYEQEPVEVKEAIVKLSQAMRKAYPEINDELFSLRVEPCQQDILSGNDRNQLHLV